MTEKNAENLLAIVNLKIEKANERLNKINLKIEQNQRKNDVILAESRKNKSNLEELEVKIKSLNVNHKEIGGVVEENINIASSLEKESNNLLIKKAILENKIEELRTTIDNSLIEATPSIKKEYEKILKDKISLENDISNLNAKVNSVSIILETKKQEFKDLEKVITENNQSKEIILSITEEKAKKLSDINQNILILSEILLSIKEDIKIAKAELEDIGKETEKAQEKFNEMLLKGNILLNREAQLKEHQREIIIDGAKLGKKFEYDW